MPPRDADFGEREVQRPAPAQWTMSVTHGGRWRGDRPDAGHRRRARRFVLNDANADLIADRVDVAFRGGPLPDSGYVGRQLLGALSDGMVASAAYIAARGTPGTLRDVATHDCVTSAHPNGRTTWRLTGPHGVEEVQVVARFSGNTTLALRKATLAGLGIALLPPAMGRVDAPAATAGGVGVHQPGAGKAERGERATGSAPIRTSLTKRHQSAHSDQGLPRPTREGEGPLWRHQS